MKIEEMDYDEFVGYCAGKLTLAIGKGEFLTELYNVLRLSDLWTDNNRKKNTSGVYYQLKKKEDESEKLKCQLKEKDIIISNLADRIEKDNSY